MLSRALVFAVCCSVSGCGSKQAPEDVNIRVVKLPNGREIRCELMLKDFEVRRGMMFRESAPPGTGMLFVHPKPGKYPYWMYQVKIPLDIIWMDSEHRVVEISPNTPACRSKASECPSYGGQAMARYVLELGAGEAQRHRIQVGDTLTF